MDIAERGSKHVCPECKTKYYDLRREVVACPKCGTKAPEAKVLKPASPARKAVRSTYWR